MNKKLNIVFCGTLNNEESGSWDKTNGFFFRALSEQATCITFDYTIKNVFKKRIYKFLKDLWYGETLIRDPFYDYLLEKNFITLYKKLQNTPDLVIHSSSICVPKGYDKKCSHVLYTDATIMGSIKYNNFKPRIKALNLFLKETRKYINRVQYIFTFNEWTKQSLIEDFAVDEHKVVNVGFGANLNPYFGEKDYNNNQLLIVLRRGLEQNKGLFLLLEAFKIAKRQNSSLKLAVVGTTLEPMDGVTYYEGFPREKTIELFQQASLYAMPAIFEPNGMVYIEALACKTPILGLNRLAFPEFCGYGQYGFIVEDKANIIGQTILSAFNSPQKLKMMGEKGQEYVINRFNWENVVKNIIEKSIKN